MPERGPARGDTLLEIEKRTAEAFVATFTAPCPAWSPLEFLRGAEAPRILVEDAERGVVYAAAGAVRTLIARGPHRFADLEAEAQRLSSCLVFGRGPLLARGPRFLGGFSFFDSDEETGEWEAHAPAYFVLPRALLAHTREGTFLTLATDVDAGESAAIVERRLQESMREHVEDARGPTFTQGIRKNSGARRPGVTRAPRPLASPEGLDVVFDPVTREDREAWRARVATSLRAIDAGDLDKVVLSRTRSGRAPDPIDPLHVLARLEGASPGCSRFLVEPASGHAFLGATPETLLMREGADVRTHALASTTLLDAGEDCARGPALRGGAVSPRNDGRDGGAAGRALLEDPKERHEHALVVDAIRASLTPHAADVNVESQPSLVRSANVQHLRTRIHARLASPVPVLTLARDLHPTPAVGGSPTQVALAQLRAFAEPRGWYAGGVGWFDPGGDGTFLVALRCALLRGEHARVFAGAGIVAQSEAEREFEETEAKARPMIEALGGVP